jgi:hypothetical protein
MQPRAHLPQVPWSVLARRDWDQLAQASLMVLFGIWGLSGAPRSSALSPLGTAALLVFDIEFIVVGVLLIIGLRTNSWVLRRRAYMIYSAALLLLAAMLVFVRPSSFIALALGFAMQGIVTVRMLRRQEQIALRALRDPHEQAAGSQLDVDGFGRTNM